MDSLCWFAQAAHCHSRNDRTQLLPQSPSHPYKLTAARIDTRHCSGISKTDFTAMALAPTILSCFAASSFLSPDWFAAWTQQLQADTRTHSLCQRLQDLMSWAGSYRLALEFDMFVRLKTQLMALGDFRMLPLVDFFMLKNLRMRSDRLCVKFQILDPGP